MIRAHLSGRVGKVNDQRPVRRRKEKDEQHGNHEEEVIPADECAVSGRTVFCLSILRMGGIATRQMVPTAHFRRSEYSAVLLDLKPCWSEIPIPDQLGPVLSCLSTSFHCRCLHLHPMTESQAAHAQCRAIHSAGRRAHSQGR